MSNFYPHKYYREEDVEAMLIQGRCFNQYYFYNYKKNLTRLNESLPRRVHCDLIAISKDLSHWAIVEVELAHHDVTNHIWPQVIRLKEIAQMLTLKEREMILFDLGLDTTIVQKIKHDEPRVFLIFDKSRFNLNPILTFMGPIGTTMFVNAFKNDFNEYIYNEEIFFENCIIKTESVVYPYANRLHIRCPSILGLNISVNQKIYILDSLNNPIETIIWNELVSVPENSINTEMKLILIDGTLKLLKNGI